MPSLDIAVIDQPNILSTGAGEVALVAGPPAIANAIRHASGIRPLRLPFATPMLKVKALALRRTKIIH